MPFPPKDDNEIIQVKVKTGETIPVRFGTLLISPVLRNALLTHTLPGRHHEEDKTGDTEPQEMTIELNGSLQASKWFIGLLEATDLNQLATFDLPRCPPTWELAKEFLRQDSSPSVLSEALSMSDFYDIAFFKILMVETIRRIAKQGHIYALSAFVMGVKMRDLEVTNLALGYMSDLPDPDSFDLPLTEAIGLPAFRILIQAYCIANNCERFQPEALIQVIDLD